MAYERVKPTRIMMQGPLNVKKGATLFVVAYTSFLKTCKQQLPFVYLACLRPYKGLELQHLWAARKRNVS